MSLNVVSNSYSNKASLDNMIARQIVINRQSQYVSAAVRQHLARCATETQHPAMDPFKAATDDFDSVTSPAAHAVAKRLIIDHMIAMLENLREHTDLVLSDAA